MVFLGGDRDRLRSRSSKGNLRLGLGGVRERAAFLGEGEGDLARLSEEETFFMAFRDPTGLCGGDLERAGDSFDGDLVPLELGGVGDRIGLRETDLER